VWVVAGLGIGWVLLTLLVLPVLGRALGYGERRTATLRRTPAIEADRSAHWPVPQPRTWQVTGNTVMSVPPR
jgi:hypothetical protein